MTDKNIKTQVVLEEIPDTAVIVRGGVRIEFNASGDITVYSNGNVRRRPAANDGDQPAPKSGPQIGDRIEDGTVYAGISPDTGTPLYTTPADAPSSMRWREVNQYTAVLDTHGHKDWRLPSPAELHVLFNNRAAIGGFDTSGSFPAGYYWSSPANSTYVAWSQRFSDGTRIGSHDRESELSVRLVRS